MIALPAIDLRGGACVQLVGGDYAAERVRVPDPVRQAADFEQAGFTWLHVVDLDAATGRGDNARVIESIAKSTRMALQVGGGVRDVARAESLFALGVARVIVGTRGVEDRAFRDEMAGRFPGRIVLALDVRGDEVLVRGWQSSSGRRVADVLQETESLDLAGILVTAVHKEGLQGGADTSLMANLATSTKHPLIASGGVSTLSDLEDLARAGCAGAVIGMALYTGALDPRATAAAFGGGARGPSA